MAGVFFIIWTVVIGLLFHEGSTATENKRLYSKCLVELEQKAHKEVIEFCKERVK